MPMICGARRDGARDLGLVVRLDQRVQLEPAGEAEQLGQRRVVQRRDDQQDARPRPPAIASTIWYGSTMKSLRSTGKPLRRARRLQIVEPPAEERLVGQHRQRAGAARRIGAHRASRGRPSR